MRRDKQSSISIAEYLARVTKLGSVHRIRDVQTRPLEECLGAVLARDLTAQADVPRFPNSAMDGYAVQHGDLVNGPTELRIVGDQPAGLKRDLTVSAGEAVRIMTGAPLPFGADTVVQSELTEERGTTVRILERVRAGANVRQPGEDVSAGMEVLSKGTRLGARQLSAAAAAGFAELEVYRRLRVGVIATGDEIVPPGGALEAGEIYESNTYLLAGLAQESGALVTQRNVVGDAPEALAEVLSATAASSDAVLLSGGVSVGHYDVVRNLLEGAEGAFFQRVALQPGKPQGQAIWSGKPLLAFPGNPVGAFVSFHVFGRAFLEAVASGVAADRPRRKARAATGWKTPTGRTQYVPGYLRTEGGQVFHPVSEYGSGSHLVTTLGRATCLAIIPADVDYVEPGDTVQVEEIC